MKIKGIKDECFGDFKDIGMLVVFPNCSFKCDKDSGCQVCQNSALANEPVIDVPIETIINQYLINPLSNTFICGGLEPFDSPADLLELLQEFREKSDDAIVIYTGYTEFEVQKLVNFDQFKALGNLYIKYGRFKPNQNRILMSYLG